MGELTLKQNFVQVINHYNDANKNNAKTLETAYYQQLASLTCDQVPKVLSVTGNKIEMEYIESIPLKNFIAAGG